MLQHLSTDLIKQSRRCLPRAGYEPSTKDSFGSLKSQFKKEATRKEHNQYKFQVSWFRLAIVMALVFPRCDPERMVVVVASTLGEVGRGPQISQAGGGRPAVENRPCC